MMKWKARTETMDIGILELDNLTFNEDYIEISVDICGVSEGLKAEIDKAIEIEKKKYIVKQMELFERYPKLRSEVLLHWSDNPVVMDFSFLRVVLEVGRPNIYLICFGFHDASDNRMEAWDGEIKVDLSMYESELKKAVIKVLLDKFF